MSVQELTILLPCHSLEDFPQHLRGSEADGLLAGWSALWHPALLVAAKGLPNWCRADDPPTDLAGHLLVIPPVSEPLVPAGLAERAVEQGAWVIRDRISREQIVSDALSQLELRIHEVNRELATDFLALGFCYLQIELLTRQMHYSTNLDQGRVESQVLSAAGAAMEGKEDVAREHLTRCFDALAEERDHYYPVEVYLLDLTLVAPTTIGSALQKELVRDTPVNLLMSAGTLSQIAEREPETLALLQKAVSAKTASVVGGEHTERDLPVLTCEAVLQEVTRGLTEYERHLSVRPYVFGRRRFGLTPVLPQIISKLGFDGALHATLDDGRFPESTQSKTRWEGIDGTNIDALAKSPLDATLPETFLNYSVRLGESMDMDHVATVCLAHWPGQTAVWFDDLRRIARYVPVLGKFVTIAGYFEDSSSPGQLDRFEPDQYHSPYLEQAVADGAPDPISAVARECQQATHQAAVESFEALVDLLSGYPTGVAENQTVQPPPADAGLNQPVESEDGQQTSFVGRSMTALSRCLGNSVDSPGSAYLVLNPFSFARRIGFQAPKLDTRPLVRQPVYATGDDEEVSVVVDVPPMGYAWVKSGPPGHRTKREGKRIAEDNILRNEYMEVHINESSGGIKSIYDFRTRNNRISQQLAFRMAGADGRGVRGRQRDDLNADYSVMQVDEIRVTHNNAAWGRIESHGRLLDHRGQVLARYEQSCSLWRGSRVLLLDLRLDPLREPEPHPWNSYYACRFAWADPGASLFRSVGLTRQSTAVERIEAPHFVEVEMPDIRTAILTGGHPYHRRVGLRTLDSLLVVRGESSRNFRLGIGIDVAHPAQDALALLAPDCWIAQTGGTTSDNPSGWLFHVDARNVVATHWAALQENGRVVGFRVRLLETSGRSGQVDLDCLHSILDARKVDFQGNPLEECNVNESRIRLELVQYEWAQIEARWKEGADQP